MASILTEFAYGNINPAERSFDRNSEYGRAVKAVAESEDILLKALSESEKALYDHFAATQRNMSVLDSAEKFVFAYRLGALMMLEVIAGKDEVVGI